MKRTLATMLLMTLVAASVRAQVQGDSVRLRVYPSSNWIYGRIVSLDSSQLTVAHSDGSVSYSLRTLGRAEVLRRRSRVGTLLGGVFVMEVGTGLAAATSPREKVGTYVAAAGLGAGLGLCIGAADLKAHPWRWVRVRVKAAT